MATDLALAVPAIDLPNLVRRYADGVPVPELAAEHGVHRATLYRWMLGAVGDTQYTESVTHALVRRIADADGDLAASKDACDIARARETARFARMDYERRRPHLYGQHQIIDSAPSVVLNLNFSGEKSIKSVELDALPDK